MVRDASLRMMSEKRQKMLAVEVDGCILTFLCFPWLFSDDNMLKRHPVDRNLY